MCLEKQFLVTPKSIRKKCPISLGSRNKYLHFKEDRETIEQSNIDTIEYTEEEIDAMINVVESDSKDKLLITILREIGLRNSAICNLKFRDIVDDYNCPKHLCRVKEKGNKYREFVTTPNIKKILVTYIHELDKMLEMDKIVFSRSKKLDTKMASATLNNVLKK